MTGVRPLGVGFGILLALLLNGMAANSIAHAGSGRATKELVKELCEQFGAKLTRTQANTLAKRVEVIVSKYGDEGAAALRKSGPAAVEAIEAAGKHGDQCIKLLARRGDEAIWIVSQPKRLAIFVKHGDDAATAMIKHGEIVENTIQTFGDDAASALARVNGLNARRVAMMANDGLFGKVPAHSPQLFSVIRKQGDEAAEFIWKNKGALAVTATLIAFVRDPEAFIDGTKELGATTIEHVIEPIVHEAAAQFPWSAMWMAVVLVVVIALWRAANFGRPTVLSSQRIESLSEQSSTLSAIQNRRF